MNFGLQFRNFICLTNRNGEFQNLVHDKIFTSMRVGLCRMSNINHVSEDTMLLVRALPYGLHFANNPTRSTVLLNIIISLLCMFRASMCP